MYNLHCHSLLSDGALLPSELAVRFAEAGYKVIAITDHADYSNIGQVVSSTLDFTRHWPKDSRIKVIPGVELTHIPPEQFVPLVKYARAKGAKVIVGHGETPVEPVIKGTNHAAIVSGVDILAHPGLISDKDVALAKKKGVLLELTARAGHRDTNAYVADKARAFGASLALNLDAHSPADIISPLQLKKVGRDAGLSEEDILAIYRKTAAFLKRKGVG